MRKLIQRASGLVVPEEQPKPEPKSDLPGKIYGATEINREASRKKIAEALLQLWDAIGLSSGGGGICLDGDPNAALVRHHMHYQAYRYIGEMLLGKECPEKAQLT